LERKINGEKLKKSFGGKTIGTSPKLDGRSSSSLLRKIVEEMENISISGWNKKVKI
jgi:ribosomal protein S19E (S16A)